MASPPEKNAMSAVSGTGLKVADRWFERRRIADDITLMSEPHVDPFIRCNIWHVRGRDRDLLVDTGLGIASLRAAVADLFEKPLRVVATHAHYDHIGGHHEFDDCLAHPLEADRLRHADREPFRALARDSLPAAYRESIEAFGYPLPDLLVTAIPEKGYDVHAYGLKGARNVDEIDEGDLVDLGDRSFRVLHLPGHTPGSIGLWEEATRTLFSGDAIYDGPLLGNLPESDRASYVATLERLRRLPVEIVHAGHETSFGHVRLVEIIDEYLTLWKA